MSLPKLNTPTFELELPSTGKKVRYRPFLVKEHKVLLTMVDADDKEVSRIVEELVDACTFNALDISKVPYFDLEYIFLHLRAKSIGESVDVNVTCGCGEKYGSSYNIEDVKVEKSDKHQFKIMLTDTMGVEMTYPKFKQIVEVHNAQDPSIVVKLVIDSVKGVFNEENYWEMNEQPEEEKEEFINTLTKQQFDKIENFFVTSPKVVQVVESDCPKCNKHNVNRIEGLETFFV